MMSLKTPAADDGSGIDALILHIDNLLRQDDLGRLGDIYHLYIGYIGLEMWIFENFRGY